MIRDLKDEDSNVRYNASEALEKIAWQPKDDVEKAYYLIVKKLWDEVAKLGKPAAELLIKALKDKDRLVREWAASALGKIGDSRAIGPLNEALKDKDEDVREAAEGALEKIKAKKS